MRRAVFQMAVLLGVLAIPGHTDAPGRLEYRVKAAILFNISKFIEWPSLEPSANLEFCVLGQDPFGSILDESLAGKRIGARLIAVRRYQRLTNLTPCNLLFISSSETPRIKPILAALGGRDTLTVSEIPRFAEQGGMINFILQDGAVRFEINVSAAQDAGLRISSQLLRLARIVGRRDKK